MILCKLIHFMYGTVYSYINQCLILNTTWHWQHPVKYGYTSLPSNYKSRYLLFSQIWRVVIIYRYRNMTRHYPSPSPSQPLFCRDRNNVSIDHLCWCRPHYTFSISFHRKCHLSTIFISNHHLLKSFYDIHTWSCFICRIITTHVFAVSTLNGLITPTISRAMLYRFTFSYLCPLTPYTVSDRGSLLNKLSQ